MELLCLGKVTDRGRIGTNHRLFLEALLVDKAFDVA